MAPHPSRHQTTWHHIPADPKLRGTTSQRTPNYVAPHSSGPHSSGPQTMWHHIPAGSNHQLTTVRTSLSLCKVRVYTICYLALLAHSPTKTGVSLHSPIHYRCWGTSDSLLAVRWKISETKHSSFRIKVFHLFQYNAAYFWVQCVSLCSSVHQHTHWQLSDRIFLNFILENFTKLASGISVSIISVQLQQPLYVNAPYAFSMHHIRNSWNSLEK